MFPRSELLRAHPVFLLEIQWGSYTYRFATKAVHLLDVDVYLPFTGHIDNPQYQERSELLGLDIEEKSVPFSLMFAGVNVALQEMRGNTIEGSTAELSYILDGIHTNYDERIILAQGTISQPVYGHPDRPAEYLECSLESTSIVNAIGLLPAQNARYTLTADTDPTVTFNDRNQGKVIPIVFGSFTFIDGTEIYTIPSYFIGSPSLGTIFLTAACNHVLSTTAKVKDTKNHTDTGDIVLTGTSQGDKFINYSKIQIGTSFTVEDPATNTDIQYWAYLDKGIPSPYSDDVLTGGGDLCLWALTVSGVDVDYDAWYNVRHFLNEYKFAGVITDDGVTGLDFIQQDIIPYLPIEIVLGNKGLSPRLNLMVEGVTVTPVDHITAGSVFYRTGPVIPLTEPQDICNSVTVYFCWQGLKQAYFAGVYVGIDQPGELRNLSNESIQEYSIVSTSKYGVKHTILELNYVYDYATASRIAQEYIRFNSMPRLGITYNAVGYYGWLQVGDVIELTDSDISIDRQKAQIVSKRWNETHWEFTLELEINHISNEKRLN